MSIIFRPQCQLYYVHMTRKGDYGLFISYALIPVLNTCIDGSYLKLFLTVY
jgi:hypothetical protein